MHLVREDLYDASTLERIPCDVDSSLLDAERVIIHRGAVFALNWSGSAVMIVNLFSATVLAGIPMP